MAATDPHLTLLSSIAAELGQKEGPSNRWVGSPFEWIVGLPSGTKGKTGKLILDQWMRSRDIAVVASPESPGGRWVNGRLIQIRMSTLWAGGFYKFQQIKPGDFDAMVFLGLSPFAAHGWLVPKADLIEHTLRNGQHVFDGVAASSWLQVDPQAPPPWLVEHGGSLAQLEDRLLQPSVQGRQ